MYIPVMALTKPCMPIMVHQESEEPLIIHRVLLERLMILEFGTGCLLKMKSNTSLRIKLFIKLTRSLQCVLYVYNIF